MSETNDAPWTVLRLLEWTKGYFARADLGEPRLAAEVLLAHVLACGRIDLYARHDHLPSDEQLAAYRGLVARAALHEPVAYLVGEKEFYSLKLKVTRDVLVPRPETEVVVCEAVAHLRSLGRPGRMWDVCTGSGCVAIAAAVQVSDAAALATDVSPEAVTVAEKNVEAHGLSDRICCRVADLLELPDDCEQWRQVDVLTSNPPYVADGDEIGEEVKHEPRIALFAGPEGLELLRPLIAAAGDAIAPGGKLILEFGLDQGDVVRELIAAAGAFDEPRILRDLHHIERTAVAARR